jgi:hypothetical protein
MLTKLAQGEANKIFIIPSEFSQARGNRRRRRRLRPAALAAAGDAGARS